MFNGKSCMSHRKQKLKTTFIHMLKGQIKTTNLIFKGVSTEMGHFSLHTTYADMA